jgi:transcriptional regulator with XRE-family HTH domain
LLAASVKRPFQLDRDRESGYFDPLSAASEERGLSQEALAELAGVHRTYVGMLERREKNVTIYNIERIAKALKIEAFELLRPKRATR